MSLIETIEHLDLTRLIVTDGIDTSKVVALRDDRNNYGRISRDNDGFAYIGWLQGKGHGNLLVLGMLQESIKLDCEVLTGSPLPWDGTRIEDLLRFYKQFGLKYDVRLSKRRNKLMYSGKPFECPEVYRVIIRIQEKYKTKLL